MFCRRKFINAANLLEIRGPVINKLRDFGFDRINLWPLMGMFKVVCERYIEEFYTGQEELFERHLGGQDMKWSRYWHHVLVPNLLQDDDFVRNVLRAMMAIPCKSPKQAGDALIQIILEMTLPETKPPWSPEDEIYY